MKYYHFRHLVNDFMFYQKYHDQNKSSLVTCVSFRGNFEVKHLNGNKNKWEDISYTCYSGDI